MLLNRNRFFSSHALGGLKRPSFAVAPSPRIPAPSKAASAFNNNRDRGHKPVKIDKRDWDVNIVFDKIEKGEINLEPE